MILDLSTFSATQVYHLMTQSVIPRPIAWALTNSGTKDQPNYNLAPFSYFAPVSSHPPLLMLSVGNKQPGEPKDTVLNAKENKKIVVHIAHETQYKEVTATAATLERSMSEVSVNELATVEFEGFDLPRLKDCDIAFGCEFYEVKEIGDAPQHLLFLEITHLYLADKIAKKDENGRITIDPTEVKPLSRLGASLYSKMGEVFSQKRPD